MDEKKELQKIEKAKLNLQKLQKDFLRKKQLKIEQEMKKNSPEFFQLKNTISQFEHYQEFLDFLQKNNLKKLLNFFQQKTEEKL